MKGKFITLEGIEGAGKTTQLAVIRSYLEDRGIALLTTREPGGSPVGERIRSLLLDPTGGNMAADTEVLLLFAARAEHLAHRIRPALEQGTWVLCDRFTDATYAYQGGGRGVDPQRIALLEDYVQGPMRPDLTFLFDLPAAVGCARAGRRSTPDRFESETEGFFADVRARYLALADSHLQRIRRIDANAPVAKVSAQVYRQIAAFVEAMDP